MLKHFPKYKMKFTPDAKCLTIAPDTWDTLLSQRRRWINSTVHNLVELVNLPQLCGFCCFSMRFVVFIDLFATVIMPATLVYLGYLVYQLAFSDSELPVISLILLAAVYGLQMIIFMLKRQWQHLAWMIIHLMALPVYSFFLPVYAFWHFDDFSWGNTRIVIGEQGKKQKIPADEEPFDPASIPRMTWEEYQQEHAEVRSVESFHSEATAVSRASRQSRAGGGRPRSVAGGSNYGGGDDDRPASVVGSPSRRSSRNGGGTHENYHHPLADFVYYSGGPVPDPGYASLDSPMGSPLASFFAQQQYHNNSNYQPPLSPGALSRTGSVSNYSVVAGGGPSLGPSDDEISEAVRDILSTADLMKITKKGVRDEVSRRFSVDMGAIGRKTYINRCIERVLSTMAQQNANP
ncbi:MAG: chitin synthase-domain-containing protein [Olpidium bornovanus]|uniref:Chitin synthase-domain-containing protein n=1 Tax=Olpidium bornovanus TaxID=278681 RepID=A0A8H7ZYL2_9FUNG|nr:MAG: chitin synthase-domain-containing protein [Olpidium bornovanus]